MNKDTEEEKVLIEDRVRIDTIIEALGVNPNGLSKSLGYKNHGSIYNIGKVIDGRKIKMGKSLIHKLVTKYPQVSLKYATYGIGDVLLTGKAINTQINALGIESGEQMTFEEEIRIRLDEMDERLNKINDKLDQLLKK